ncbi:Nuclear pore complex protein Nup85 AltName: Full=85 kDa nucleoporin [Rhizoctonia solani AG-1 IB]|uniref:Nuclear pore complex protein Nup85 n=1 Tax=Thanatephorus cucumeris (strain AG1-IB / isolate 7/3/14) TaxID=1108050 RepID=M5BQ19_THACB|nr:Nuclear pore complex protein Nup85 AltName: Full=85 kDa nucleoporin [Rhizoctonia solani AG-1 IB]
MTERFRLILVRLSEEQITSYYSRSIEQYINDAKKQITSLASQDPLPSTYPTYVNILETLQLVQTVYAPHGGQINGLIGEQLLQWLNTSHTVPATAELLRLSALPEPWSDPDFWPTLNKCLLRGLSTSALGFLRRVASNHPSAILRTFIRDSLVPALESHPRSSDFQRESGFLTAHSRWRERVVEVRVVFDKLDPEEGDEDEWSRWVDELLGVLEGDAGVVFALCNEAVEDGWGFREVIGVWGVWVDVGLKRTQLAKVVEKVSEQMPPDLTIPVQELHRAILAMEELEALEVAAQVDPWLAAHLADIFEKVETLDPHDEIAQTYGMSIRDHFVLSYAEHLHSDPTLFEIELEYMGRCGTIGRERISAVISHIPVIPPPTDPKASEKALSRLKSLGVDDQGLPLAPRIVDAGMWEGCDRVDKLLSVCDQFGLRDESREICKAVAQHLTREKSYGLAISYCAFAQDVRGVGRIATLLLEEYVQNGSAAFVKHVAQIPARYMRVNATDPISARLQFVARFADFHTFSEDGAKGEAVRLLVRMLDRSIVPRAWQAVVLLDAASLLEGSEEDLLITTDDAYELLRYLQNIYTQAALGAGSDYLEVLARITMRGKGSTAETEALQSLDIVRLVLARYLARCTVQRI